MATTPDRDTQDASTESNAPEIKRGTVTVKGPRGKPFVVNYTATITRYDPLTPEGAERVRRLAVALGMIK